jgi:hypothetical protein
MPLIALDKDMSGQASTGPLSTLRSTAEGWVQPSVKLLKLREFLVPGSERFHGSDQWV